MLVQPTQEQREVLKALSNSNDGKVLKEYVDALISTVCDVRKGGDVDPEVRKGVAQILEEDISKRLEHTEQKENKPTSYE